jgi:hypothetical protein
MYEPTRPGLKHRIYMNVGYDLNVTQIRNYFMRYGCVLDVYLPKHKVGRVCAFEAHPFPTGIGSLLVCQVLWPFLPKPCLDYSCKFSSSLQFMSFSVVKT